MKQTKKKPATRKTKPKKTAKRASAVMKAFSAQDLFLKLDEIVNRLIQIEIKLAAIPAIATPMPFMTRVDDAPIAAAESNQDIEPEIDVLSPSSDCPSPYIPVATSETSSIDDDSDRLSLD